MSKRAYNWLTNVAIILGVAAALLYDSPRVPHVVSIALAIIAGVFAAGVYLYNQFLRTKKATVDENFLRTIENLDGLNSLQIPSRIATIHEPSDDTAFARVEQNQRAKATIDALLAAEVNLAVQRQLANRQREMLKMARAGEFAQQFLTHSAFARDLRYSFQGAKRLVTPEVELSPKEAALCYTEIIRQISHDDKMKSWEYHVDRNGLHLSEVSSASTHKGDDVQMDLMEFLLKPSQSADEEQLEEA
jgi:hypothetical protein